MTEDELPADPKDYERIEPTPTERVRGAVDSMAAVNEFLWQMAKMVGIMTLILLFAFMLFIAWQVAQWGATL